MIPLNSHYHSRFKQLAEQVKKKKAEAAEWTVVFGKVADDLWHFCKSAKTKAEWNLVFDDLWCDTFEFWIYIADCLSTQIDPSSCVYYINILAMLQTLFNWGSSLKEKSSKIILVI